MNTTETHKHFSCECFNQTWGLLDLPERSSEQVRKMLALSHASLFHWLSREDCEPQNLSIGLWLLSRVYSVIESSIEAMRYAKDCLDVSETASLNPFYMAYAHEAVSRAALIGGNVVLAKEHLNLANDYAVNVSEANDKNLINSDLKELQEKLA